VNEWVCVCCGLDVGREGKWIYLVVGMSEMVRGENVRLEIGYTFVVPSSLTY
jgi:hypothetical protein